MTIYTRKTTGSGVVNKNAKLTNEELDNNFIEIASGVPASGVDAATLHKSPNAITSMFIYDTSKDSDGGAWTEKCQHTSWYNEPLCGKWLGAADSELLARHVGATLGGELVTNGDFTDGTTGWATLDASISNSGQVLNITSTSGAGYAYIWVTTVVGKTYTISYVISSGSTGLLQRVGTTTIGSQNLTLSAPPGTQAKGIFTATATSTCVSFGLFFGSGTGLVDNISVREVTTQTTQTGDYFQLTTDGKFYKLNETSGTTEVFRGNKAKFPKLAGIVADGSSNSSTVTIYDLTEPGRPMWMRFKKPGTAFSLVGYYTADISAVAMSNGLLLVGCSGTNGSLNEINFVSEQAVKVHVTFNSGCMPGLLVNRNASIWASYSFGAAWSIANRSVNAVAMTVLPDAPIDPVTGLAVPTIAVATAGGVSVIKHNGTVVNSSSTSSFAKVNITPTTLTAGRADTTLYSALNPGQLGSSFALSTVTTGEFSRGNTAQLKAAGQSDLIRSSGALITKRRNNEVVAGNSLNATITNTYNTGYMVGDVKRCYLSDITAESVSGTELVTNGTFDTDTTGWTNVTWNNGVGRVTNTGSWVYGSQNVATVAGKTYCITADYVSTGGGISGVAAVGGYYLNTFPYYAASVGSKIRCYFIATSSTTNVNFSSVQNTNGSYFEIDNVSVKECVVDRSYKNVFSNITGTLTKSAVATNAQLVAYSGFSAANYLREPYSADLDFGTGEWSVGAWVNVPATLNSGNFQTFGPELLPDPFFDSGDGWVLSGATISGGSLNFSAVSQTASYTFPSALPAGFYKFDIAFSTNGTNSDFSVAIGSTGSGWGLYRSKTGTRTSYAYVSGGTTFTIMMGSPGGTAVIDSVSLKRVNPATIAERSYSSGPTINFGTIPVGWDVTSLLGTLTATAYDGTTTRTVTTTAAYNTATWLKAEATYKSGKLAILVNGQEVASTNGSPLLTLNNSSAVLTIGNSYALDAPFPGSLALLKLSATVPTAEQALWMYEQEKQLFRDGAQCVLPDTNNIQDLAYDDVTGNWVAISTTNRTEWSGLVRTKSTAYTETLSKVFNSKNYIMTTAGTNTYITTPGINHREMVIAKNEAGRTVAKPTANFEFDTISFTANTTTSSNVLASVGSIVGTPYIGMGITGSGIPAGTTIIGINGTTYYMSANATATASTVAITQNDYLLPVGYTAVKVMSAGNLKREGSAKDYTRLFDGFRETIRFGTSPGSAVRVQIQCISNKY